MSEYIKVYSGRHPSKHSVFRNECGGCGRPLRRNSRNKIGYLCKKCGASTKSEYNEHYTVCYYCPFEKECTIRVKLGLWIRCETPDIADLERLKFTGGLNDERIRAEVDKALAKRGDRKVLEEAIKQGAPKIYKDVIDGEERQMSLGVREYR
ncbi:MAG: hypothetical protein LUQ65_05655 [Candidatus Helarchaeota archaeon]|nr:hypothetical protein [Candidatus Helarchaeota archaeon]